MARWRRYRTADGFEFETIEVPVAVLGRFGYSNIEKALDKAERGLIRRSLAARRKQEVVALHAQGANDIEIHRRLGIAPTRVRAIRLELGLQQNYRR